MKISKENKRERFAEKIQITTSADKISVTWFIKSTKLQDNSGKKLCTWLHLLELR